MTNLEVVRLSDDRLQRLKASLLKKSAIFPIASDFELASLLISYGISQEVGTVNDELSRFIFDAQTEQLIPRETLRGQVIRWGGKVGVRIFSTASTKLEVRIRGFRDLCHPALSENEDGSFHQIVLFPEIAVAIAAMNEIELVIVQTWAINSIFGGFDRNKGYYETNFWELENNDTLLFADLVRQRKLAFLGTHDLIAHVAGVSGKKWQPLAGNAARVRRGIETYIGTNRPSIPDLVLPYTAGVILDDLAQPPSYLSPSHQIMLDEVLSVMEIPRKAIPNALLLKYPATFEDVIKLSRSSSLTRETARAVVAQFAQEILANTAQIA